MGKTFIYIYSKRYPILQRYRYRNVALWPFLDAIEICYISCISWNISLSRYVLFLSMLFTTIYIYIYVSTACIIIVTKKQEGGTYVMFTLSWLHTVFVMLYFMLQVLYYIFNRHNIQTHEINRPLNLLGKTIIYIYTSFSTASYLVVPIFWIFLYRGDGVSFGSASMHIMTCVTITIDIA